MSLCSGSEDAKRGEIYLKHLFVHFREYDGLKFAWVLRERALTGFRVVFIHQ